VNLLAWIGGPVAVPVERFLVEVDDHVLHLGVQLKRVLRQLTADAGLLVAAERSFRGIDPLDIVGPDRRCQTVDRIVGHPGDFLVILERDNRQNRAEDLFLGNGHVVGDVVEDGWLDEVAVGKSLFGDSAATVGEICSAFLGHLDIAQDAVALIRRNHWSHLGVPVQRVANPDLGRARDEIAHELVLDGFVQEESGTGSTALTGVGEDCEQGTGNGLIDIGIREDDVRALATQFQRYLLDGAGGSADDVAAGFGFTGEGDLVDVRMFAQGRADERTGA
jgi:hypothetical protein